MNWRKPLIYLLLYATGSKIPKNLKTIHRLAAASRDEVLSYQKGKLKKLLLYAHDHVPYYSKVLSEAGVVQDGKVLLEHFENIPVLTKDIIRRQGDNLYTMEKRKGVYENTSGGSTGEPVRFLQDKYYNEWNIANKLYYKATFGGQYPGEPELRLWGSDADIIEGQEKILTRLRNFVYNRREVNTFQIRPDDLNAFPLFIAKYKPKWIEAYVQSAYEFACYLTQHGIKINNVSGILTSAGTLYPAMRETIEKAFNCQVFNRYGSREVGDMACSCERNEALHLSPWSHYLEIMRTDVQPVEPGETGRIIVTLLNNYSMPMIRYDIGDIAVAHDGSKCQCGRSMPMLMKVEGREMSIFRKKDGGFIPGEFFIHFLGVVRNQGIIRKFQIIQKDYETINIHYVPNNNNGLAQYFKQIEHDIRKVMGDKTVINWFQEDHIPPLPSGKHVYTLSEVR